MSPAVVECESHSPDDKIARALSQHGGVTNILKLPLRDISRCILGYSDDPVLDKDLKKRISSETRKMSINIKRIFIDRLDFVVRKGTGNVVMVHIPLPFIQSLLNTTASHSSNSDNSNNLPLLNEAAENDSTLDSENEVLKSKSVVNKDELRTCDECKHHWIKSCRDINYKHISPKATYAETCLFFEEKM